MANSSTYWARQPWIRGPFMDGVFILSPAILVTLAVLIFPGFFESGGGVSPLMWLLLIVGIDVSHVYSTLYRTYFDRDEFHRYKKPLIWIPILAWVIGTGLYFISGAVFWTVLAYLAVYHFVRQQYGFFAIYSRKENRSKTERLLDKCAIYGATIYPLIYWHTHLPRPFNWFIEGDFLALPYPIIATISGWIYVGILALYVLKEAKNTAQNGFNFPKNVILLGTCLSWYVGIVLFSGDLAFTATNVISHGIPYMALIWAYGNKKAAPTPQDSPKPSARKRVRIFFKPLMIPLFLGLLIFLGYLEEGLWDGMVWRTHGEWFPWASHLPFSTSTLFLAIIIPLLAVPQVTHYVIDGFIWRMRRDDSELKEVMKG